MRGSRTERPTFIGQANHRNLRRGFGIKQRDRFSHALLIGRTGTGKSTLLRTMAVQDIASGYGMALIDPHGDLSDAVAEEASRYTDRELTYLDGATLRSKPFAREQLLTGAVWKGGDSPSPTGGADPRTHGELCRLLVACCPVWLCWFFTIATIVLLIVLIILLL